MIARLLDTLRKYPRQFWLMFFGMLLSTLGSSMIWPFLMVFVGKRVSLPLAALGGMMTLNSAASLAMSFAAGPVVDRLGRKWVMAISLAANGVTYYLLGQANTPPAFTLLIMLMGAFTPLYRIGSDAMLADLIPTEKRADAYALLRLSNNLGIAVGPAVGGFITASSYSVAFTLAMAGMLIYSLMLAIFARETLPAGGARKLTWQQAASGYTHVFGDRPFLRFIAAFTLVQISAALIWILMPVYAQKNFGVPENQYGFIPVTNAVMVVGLQVLVTQRAKLFSPLRVMAVGAFFYGSAAGSVALGQGFWGFWLSMVWMTLGELLLVPTASTYVAALAPVEMRGRYMSVAGLTWGVAAGTGPLLGGLLSDATAPAAPWMLGLAAGLASSAAFFVFQRKRLDDQPIANR